MSGYTLSVLNHTLGLILTAMYYAELRVGLGLQGELEEASQDIS